MIFWCFDVFILMSDIKMAQEIKFNREVSFLVSLKTLSIMTHNVQSTTEWHDTSGCDLTWIVHKFTSIWTEGDSRVISPWLWHLSPINIDTSWSEATEATFARQRRCWTSWLLPFTTFSTGVVCEKNSDFSSLHFWSAGSEQVKEVTWHQQLKQRRAARRFRCRGSRHLMK